ncbi:MAG TPA: acetolactate synthase small subunit [Gemmatimonadaceae bacterium]|nr:acetolactate synthase small subunit [Gemmatimonadaceae bacterium]
MTHTLIAIVQDRPGLLNRVVSLFRRRSVTIESLTVHRTDQAGINQLTMVVEVDHLAPLIVQLNKLIEVLEVVEMDHGTIPPNVCHPSAASPASVNARSQADGIA